MDDFYFSPDGQYLIVVYGDDNGAGYRLLDVNWATGSIAPHVIPVTPVPQEDYSQLRREDRRLRRVLGRQFGRSEHAPRGSVLVSASASPQ